MHRVWRGGGVSRIAGLGLGGLTQRRQHFFDTNPCPSFGTIPEFRDFWGLCVADVWTQARCYLSI